MSNSLEKEILQKFIEAIRADSSIPKELSDSISSLYEQDKISKASHLKKLVEEFVPKLTEASDESKKN